MSRGVHPRLFEQPHGAEQIGEQQPVDDEARNVGHLDGVFSNVSHSASARAAGLAQRPLGKTSSTSCILVTGLKTCRPTKRSGSPLARARRSIDSEEVVLASTASAARIACQLAEQPRLDIVILDHCLDHERGPRERLRVGHHLDVLRVDLGAQALSVL